MTLERRDEIRWDLWIDDLNERVSSVELFAQNGERVLTALIPVASPRTYTVTAVGGTLQEARADVAEP